MMHALTEAARGRMERIEIYPQSKSVRAGRAVPSNPAGIAARHKNSIPMLHCGSGAPGNDGAGYFPSDRL
jgi:hypothetical protein